MRHNPASDDPNTTLPPSRTRAGGLNRSEIRWNSTLSRHSIITGLPFYSVHQHIPGGDTEQLINRGMMIGHYGHTMILSTHWQIGNVIGTEFG